MADSMKYKVQSTKYKVSPVAARGTNAAERILIGSPRSGARHFVLCTSSFVLFERLPARRRVLCPLLFLLRRRRRQLAARDQGAPLLLGAGQLGLVGGGVVGDFVAGRRHL